MTPALSVPYLSVMAMDRDIMVRAYQAHRNGDRRLPIDEREAADKGFGEALRELEWLPGVP